MHLYMYVGRKFLLVLMLPAILLSLSCRQQSKNKDASGQLITGERTPSGTLKKVTVYPYWVTTCQFAGYYLGKEKGIYRKHGIDLNILQYKPSISTNDIIKLGQADFAVLWLVNAIEMRSSGINIVNIAQFSNRSSLMLLSKKSSGIKKIEDFNGKRAGIWDGYELQPRTLFAKYKLDTKIIRIGSTNNLFLKGAVDITNANLFDEYHTIINSGFDSSELVPFMFADYGLNFLEDGVYCLEEKLKSDPVLCVEFVKATIESWEYALNHHEESVKVILQNQVFQNMPANQSHQTWMIKKYKELYLPPGKTGMNIMLSESDYMSNAKILLQNGQISRIPPYNEFFRPYTSLLHSSTAK